MGKRRAKPIWPLYWISMKSRAVFNSDMCNGLQNLNTIDPLPCPQWSGLTGFGILERGSTSDTCNLDAPWEAQPLPGPFYQGRECHLDKAVCWFTVRRRRRAARRRGCSSMISFFFVMAMTIRTVTAKSLENSSPEIEWVISSVWPVMISSLSRQCPMEEFLSGQRLLTGLWWW